MAFHPYPQLIRKLFNVYRCGPPRCVTTPSTWPWVDHQVSRQQPLTRTPSSDSLSLRLQDSSLLTLLVTVTRRLIMQKARRHSSKKLRPLVGTWFQVLFHPGTPSPFHLSLTVLFPIGLLQCLALADGAADFRGSPSGSPLLRILRPQLLMITTGLSPPAVGLPRPFVLKELFVAKSYNPAPAVTGVVWALARSLATTDAITDCFLFLRLLRCFSSAGEPYHMHGNDGASHHRVAPFGYLRISPCQPVPAAFRRLPRPSSPVEAKASPRCPFAALILN